MRRSRGTIKEQSLNEPLINLTPLIDVVFVVLITFMIIAPVLNIDHVDLAAGAKEKPPNQKLMQTSSPLTIAVHQDNTIWVNHRQITLKELEKWLAKEKKLHPHAIPQLIHDKQAFFGTYQTIKNLLEDCGFEEMEIILQPHR